MLTGKILITGTSGFIGSRVRDTLLEAGADVVSIRRAGSPEPSAGRSIVADYADVESLRAIMSEEQPSYVLHIAGVTKGRVYEDFCRGNVMPTRNLLKAVRDEGISLQRFVHVSSLTSYGPSVPDAPLRESDPPCPIEFYGKSKLEAERVLTEEFAGMPWTMIRPAGVYGPADVDYFNLFKSAIRGWNVYFGNRQRWMSVIYVDDCVRAILQSAVHQSAQGKGYFIANEEPVTWQQFQSLVVEVVPRKVRTIDLPSSLVSLGAWTGEFATWIDHKPRLLNRQKVKMGAQQAWTCRVDEAKNDFGFVAQTDLREGIQATHDWYAEHDWYSS